MVDPYDAAVPIPNGVRPELWDGHATERIVAVITDWAKQSR